jgi:putative ABC transport system permease protein
MEIRPGFDMDEAKARILSIMKELHLGEEDVTLISPDALLSTFDNVLTAMTLGVAAIAAISMVVAGVLIMNIMLISVSQRTAEIGLLKALGASARDIQQLFLIESLIMSFAGATLGVMAGFGLVLTGRVLFPEVPFYTPLWALLGALTIAMIAGVGFAWGPAKQASRLLPVAALYQRR